MAAKKSLVKNRSKVLNYKLNKEKLQETAQKQWVLYAVDAMKQGYSLRYIRQHILENKKGAKTEKAVDEIMSKANGLIVNEHFISQKEIVAIHLNRYNRLISKLITTEELPYPDPHEYEDNNEWYAAYKQWYKSREAKIKAYYDCLDTMFNKERLLRFHDKNFELIFNREETTIVKEKKEDFDIYKLTLEEQAELLELFKKARKEDFVLMGVTEAERTENVIEEAEVIEISEEANIEKIKQKEIPPEPYISPVTAADPTIKLRESIRKLALKKIEDAGGKLTDQEKQILQYGNDN